MKMAILIRRGDGKYFQGCGYGGPGNPVPYWTDDIRKAKAYQSPETAYGAMKRFGGYRGAAETDAEGRPERWLGFITYRYRGWCVNDEAPEHFDPNDYEMNNGPLA